MTSRFHDDALEVSAALRKFPHSRNGRRPSLSPIYSPAMSVRDDKLRKAHPDHDDRLHMTTPCP